MRRNTEKRKGSPKRINLSEPSWVKSIETPELDAKANEVSVETIDLEEEGSSDSARRRRWRRVASFMRRRGRK